MALSGEFTETLQTSSGCSSEIVQPELAAAKAVAKRVIGLRSMRLELLRSWSVLDVWESY